jgi:hypothetical protein
LVRQQNMFSDPDRPADRLADLAGPITMITSVMA